MSSNNAPPPPVPGGVYTPPPPSRPSPPPSPDPGIMRTNRQQVPNRLVHETCTTLEKFGVAGQNAAARLRHVVAHIHSYTAAEVYATLDPAGTQDAIIQGRAGITGLTHALAIVRNVLILLPLLLTWAGLYWATKTYQADVNTHHDDLNHPFLELWQNGFHSSSNVNSLFSFSHLALADVVLFVLIIIVGLAADIAVRFVRTRSRTAREQLEQCAAELGNAAGQPSDTGDMVNDLLAVKERVEQILGGIATSIKEASNSMGAVATLANDFKAGAQSIAGSADKIGQQATALAGAVNGIQGAAGRMADSANSLSTQAGTMHTSQEKATDALNNLLLQYRQIAANTDNTAKEIKSAVTGFGQSLSQTQQAMQSASNSLDATVRTVGTLVPIMGQLAQALKDLTPKPPWWKRILGLS